MNYIAQIVKEEKKKQIEEMIDNHALEQMNDMSVIDKILNKDRAKGMSTGYGSLDDIIVGLKAGECIVIGGDTGMGKSAFGANILVNVSKRNIPSCFIDLENGEAVSYMRLMSLWFDKTMEWFDKDENREKMIEMKKELSLNIVYYSKEHLIPMGFRENGIAVIESVVKGEIRHGVKLFLIDPLQTIEQSDNPQQNFNLQARFIESLKDLAQKHEVTIMVLHHLRKTSYSASKTLTASEVASVTKNLYRKPTLEDFKGSSKITDTATSVWGILRPKDDPNQKLRESFWVGILKNRSGRLGEINLRFHEDTLKITEKDNFSPKFSIFKGFADSN